MNSFYKILILILLLSFSCKKKEEYSIIPEIKYIGFKVVSEISDSDTLIKGELSFSFIDGDGDLGLSQSEITSPFDTSKIYLSKYIKEDSLYVLDTVTDEILDYRFPDDLVLMGRGNVLKGDISVYIPYSLEVTDTFMYKFFVIDRAFHKSNVDSTGVFTPDMFN